MWILVVGKKVFRKEVWALNCAQTFCHVFCESLFSGIGASCLSRVNKVVFRLAQR